jgi:hypothetical protein
VGAGLAKKGVDIVIWASDNIRKSCGYLQTHKFCDTLAKAISTLAMAPKKPLPYSGDFQNAEEYVDSLLKFVTSSQLFQTLCGGVHILDFFTKDPSLYDVVLPKEWRHWLLKCDSMRLLDLLMRDDLEALSQLPPIEQPPQSFVDYIKEIRKHCLDRQYTPPKLKQKTLPRHIAVGMVPKKIHEVANFSDYIDHLAEDIAIHSGHPITHLVDFGSGQNYLGRTLASPPYNKHIIAVEGREINITGAKNMDILAKVAEREVVMRNKKIYRQVLEGDVQKREEGALKIQSESPETENVADLRPYRDLATIYSTDEGRGTIQYIQHMVDDGNLSDVVGKIEHTRTTSLESSLSDLEVSTEGEHEYTPCQHSSPPLGANGNPHTNGSLMTISIHSCGNLSHHAIRTLLMNPTVDAIAIVGCCYNLMTERLRPPTYKNPILRPNLIPLNLNARIARASEACDPHGYPMSERVGTYNGDGIRLNITSRMMAVQAPQNWTQKDSDSFFTRHYYRALLQKVFFDRGVVSKPNIDAEGQERKSMNDEITDPVILGSLRKSCYLSFNTYVRGAIEKLSKDSTQGRDVHAKMGAMTDQEIKWYSDKYEPRKKELSTMWSLMAFSAGVVESLIVTDRWLFLKEHPEKVKEAWVEPVFDYKLSPRNLVVVGIKK